MTQDIRWQQRFDSFDIADYANLSNPKLQEQIDRIGIEIYNSE